MLGWIAAYESTGRWRVTFGILSVLYVLSTALTGFRAGVLGLMAASLLTARLGEIKTVWRVVLVVSVFLAGFAVWGVRHDGATNHQSAMQSVDGRVASGVSALENIGDWWLLGTGPGQYQGSAEATRYGETVTIAFTKAMNQWLHVAVEWGLLATVGFVSLAVISLRRCGLGLLGQHAYAAPACFLLVVSIFDVVGFHWMHVGGTAILGLVFGLLFYREHNKA
ncbi:MAG: O-antigen ligase family protein [Fimbriimonadaceae bacterium]